VIAYTLSLDDEIFVPTIYTPLPVLPLHHFITATMKYLFMTVALATLSSAHQMITHFHINGKADSSCVRQPDSADPIIDLSSDAMACNIVNQYPATSKCAIKPSDNIAFEWRVDRNIAPADYPLKEPGDIRVGVTDDSHKGPCAVYMKKVSDASTATGPGDGWFKVSEDGLDSNGTFCTTRLREANAPQPGVIPQNIEAGDYLLRGEFLTLNNAGPASIGGAEQPQFYSGCVQVTVSGTSGTAKPETVSIPGYVNISTPGLIFDIWNSPTNTYKNYPIPGPQPLISNMSPYESGISVYGSLLSTTASSSRSTKQVSVTKASETPAETSVATTLAPTASSGYPLPSASASSSIQGHHKHHGPENGINVHSFPLSTNSAMPSVSAASVDSKEGSVVMVTETDYVTAAAKTDIVYGPTTFVTVTARAEISAHSHPVGRRHHI
jgi:hypothetical protein